MDCYQSVLLISGVIKIRKKYETFLPVFVFSLNCIGHNYDMISDIHKN